MNSKHTYGECGILRAAWFPILDLTPRNSTKKSTSLCISPIAANLTVGDLEDMAVKIRSIPYQDRNSTVRKPNILSLSPGRTGQVLYSYMAESDRVVSIYVVSHKVSWSRSSHISVINFNLQIQSYLCHKLSCPNSCNFAFITLSIFII